MKGSGTVPYPAQLDVLRDSDEDTVLEELTGCTA